MRPRATAAALLLILTPVPAHAAAPGPGVSAEPGRAPAGTSLRVRGSAWTPGSTVQAEVCGANAVHGSADCDTPRAVTAMVAPAGTFEAGLTVGAPPASCPCVVRVTTFPGTAGPPATATAPLTLPGHPTGPVRKDVAPVRVDIVSAELTGGGRGEMFGGRPRRTLVLRVRNAGTQPITDAPLVVGWGAGTTPDSPLAAPGTGTIQPGRTATYRIPVELPRAASGRFVVGGRFAGTVPFTTSFSTYPWGLLGANALAALLLLLGVRLSLGRRAARRRRPAPAPAPGLDELLEHLGRAGYDRDELRAFLESRRSGPVDLAALDRYLKPGEPTVPERKG
ncbi:hypothetical protein GCM10009678_69070 [Actinomadura kijaniata]|uniref:Uncharacterized protein n=1 Tax=Actinomadura namibiensis TaxID=182080 RepID=A0A7W3LYT4_ACTNM|nr:hypothetical protein [Actinomadura namibiensis]MBA8956868.1 hypothetical protein [Actinomadura namibiensis]